MDTPSKPTFKEAFRFWLKLGFISFGGPAGQIAIMREYLVAQKRWISDTKFLHALNYCMLLPGPEAQQLSIYIGWLLHGTPGGLVAGLLFILPSIFILLGLSILYVTVGNIPILHALFDGLKPAVIAIIVVALYKISKKALLSVIQVGIAVASFIALFFFNVPFPYIVVVAMIIGYLVMKYSKKSMADTETAEAQKRDETPYYLNSNSVLPHTEFRWKHALMQAGIGIVLWAVPLTLMYFFLPEFKFWSNLTFFFTQAAFITFGGAYAVLPYVAQMSVLKFGWLTHFEMIDGLALGETTPGPLIMVLAFVGFMGGFNHFNSSLFYGTIALLVTTYYTFLPCFLFIFIGAPVVEHTQKNTTVKAVLGFVTAAVVGVMFSLTVFLFKAVIFPHGFGILQIDYIYLAWIIISLIALQKYKVNMILWIGISALFGIAHFFLF
jgi:chromate transporter